MSSKNEGTPSRPGKKPAEPTDLPPDLQQANVSNVKKVEEDVVKKVEEDVVEPIQQYREGRQRRKSSAAKPH